MTLGKLGMLRISSFCARVRLRGTDLSMHSLRSPVPPAADSLNQLHGSWPATTPHRAFSPPQRHCATTPYREATVSPACEGHVV